MIGSKFTMDENIINSELRNLNNTLNEQRQLKKTLLLYLEKISEGISNANDPKDSNSLISCLNGIQKSFDNIKENINNLIELKQYLENITRSSEDDQISYSDYNSKYVLLFEKISEDNIFYYSFMESLLKYMEVIFPENLPPIPIFDKDEDALFENKEINHFDESLLEDDETHDFEETLFNKNFESNLSENDNYNNDNYNIEDEQDLLDKTLLVSSKTQTAILPYSISDLETFFLNNKEKYSSMQEIIDEKYTVSLNEYKSPAFSRFKEAFALAKKSNLPFLQALNLANELFFNTNLNPIVIKACKNLNELDIYLSCLENNCLNDFNCFNIIYT